jgi:hypothetical protein
MPPEASPAAPVAPPLPPLPPPATPVAPPPAPAPPLAPPFPPPPVPAEPDEQLHAENVPFFWQVWMPSGRLAPHGHGATSPELHLAPDPEHAT